VRENRNPSGKRFGKLRLGRARSATIPKRFRSVHHKDKGFPILLWEAFLHLFVGAKRV